MAAGLTMLAAAAAAGDALWRLGQHPERMTALYGAIGLSEIPLVPAGRQARRPVPMPAAVDWRFLPSLPDQDPGLVRLLDNAQSSRQQPPPP